MTDESKDTALRACAEAPETTPELANRLFDAFDAMVTTLKAAPREGTGPHTLMMPRESVSQAVYAFRDAMKAALLPTPLRAEAPATPEVCKTCGHWKQSATCQCAAIENEETVIEHILSHWFTQGGQAQFGELDLPAVNADGLVSAILTAVRGKLRAEALAPSPDTRLPVQTFTDTEIAAVDRALQIESLSLELRGKVIQTIALSGRRGDHAEPAPSTGTPTHQTNTTKETP